MISHAVAQRSENWDRLRLFTPTSSEFHKIVCAEMGREYVCKECGVVYEKTRKHCASPTENGCGAKGSIVVRPIVKPSTQQDDYVYRLIAQSVLGVPLGPQPTAWMERGQQEEVNAVREYEFMSGNDTELVGFITDDQGLIGASPDRQIIGKRRWLECKAPSPWVHVRHLATGDLDADHRCQLQGQLLVSGYEGVDIISYCPGFPSLILTVERDEEWISGANAILVKFVEKLHRTRAELVANYGEFKPQVALPKELRAGPDFDTFMSRPVA